jgi:nucleotide-binding universal stress UspA family protein
MISLIQRQSDGEARGYLDSVARDLQGTGRSVSCAVGSGGVADVILDWAGRTRADLIAMSTHGRSGMARWLIGSVTDKVILGAKIPVLVVRPAGTAD